MNCSDCKNLKLNYVAYVACQASCIKNESFEDDEQQVKVVVVKEESSAANNLYHLICCIMCIYALYLVKHCKGGFGEFLGACCCPLIYIIFKKFFSVPCEV